MIRKFLDISTAHLKRETRDALWDNPADAPVTTWIDTHPHDAASCFVYVPDDLDDLDNVPDDLMACIRFARSHDCDRILFDRDAETVEGLPLYADE